MNKELKALENIKHYDTRVGLHLDDYNIIEKALKNYQEGLDNAQTYVKHTSKQALYDLLGLAIKNVHPSYWKLPEQLYEDVNKALKALEIIKEIIPIEENAFEYDVGSNTYYFLDIPIAKEKYDLLKEVVVL